MTLRRSPPDDFGDRLVEPGDIQVAEIVVMIHLHDRRKLADAEAAIDNLDSELAVGSRFVSGDAVAILQLVDQLLATSNETGSAMAQQHEVVAGGLCSEVGVEREQPEDTVFGDAEMFADDFGGLRRYPTDQVLNILASAEDEFLRLLVVSRLVIRPQ